MFEDSSEVSVAPVEFKFIKYKTIHKVIGWKFLNDTEIHNTLGIIDVKIISRKECNSYYQSYSYVDQKFSMCAKAIIDSQRTTQVSHYT